MTPSSRSAPEVAGEPAIRARGLVKRYGRITAVDEVDLTVSAGDVYGYLGPNGAGKTTTLRMMLGLITPDAGTVELFGRDPLVEGVRALDGVAGFVEAPRFYPYLTGRKNLELVAALDGDGAAARIDEALDVVELTDRARDKVGGYSHGMRQRLGLAGALLRDPRLLILDEPATGLDPGGMRDMRVLIRRLADHGLTVLLSSHLMSEVEELCDHVVIIASGRVRYEGALDDLIATAGGSYELRTTDDVRAAEIVAGQRSIGDLARDARGLTFNADERATAALSIALGEAGIGIAALVPRTATLEDLFFRMTEEETAAAEQGGQEDSPSSVADETGPSSADGRRSGAPASLIAPPRSGDDEPADAAEQGVRA